MVRGEKRGNVFGFVFTPLIYLVLLLFSFLNFVVVLLNLASPNPPVFYLKEDLLDDLVEKQGDVEDDVEDDDEGYQPAKFKASSHVPHPGSEAVQGVGS